MPQRCLLRESEQPFVNKLHYDLPRVVIFRARHASRIIEAIRPVNRFIFSAIAYIIKVNNPIKLFILNEEFAIACVIGTSIAFTQATGVGMRQALLLVILIETLYSILNFNFCKIMKLFKIDERFKIILFQFSLK